ncbi:MAG: hypothetical protein M0P97_01345 [Candidatus Moranbacteria bacterium]|jgi:hypothetical protein|nr:hypothetical protein [Candidatus Moranbacteria bacterium]
MEEINNKKEEYEKIMKWRGYTVPHSVSVTIKKENETSEQRIEKQNKFLKLPENDRRKLISRETGEKIFKIGQNFGFDLQKTASIARLVRSYYFKEIKKDDFVGILVKEAGTDEETAKKIAQAVSRTIIDDESLGINKNIVKMNIEDAMKKIPEIGDQALSVISLKGKIFSDAIRPSIKNWINDYYHEIGVGKHDLMQRGDYLYHGKNAKNLSSEERQKMMAIIKSLEDGDLLDIDQEEKKVIFPEFKERKMPIKEGSLKNNFHKFFPVLKSMVKKEELTGNMERIKPIKKEEKAPTGLAKLNQKIQEDAVVSGGYSITKKKESSFDKDVKEKQGKEAEERKRQGEMRREAEKQREAEQKKIEREKEKEERQEAEKKLAEEIRRMKKEREDKELLEKKNEEMKRRQKEEVAEDENPYVIKPLSLFSNKNKKSGMENSANVIDLRK